MRPPLSCLRPPAAHPDRQLLDRFRLSRDEAAFAELVRRHGPLVWGVCRRTLSPTDAEDAFQATWLVLLRRAERLPVGDSLAPWLYRAAVLTARTARRADRRRRLRVQVGLPPAEPETPTPDAELREAVDAALLRLPAGDRAAVVLCHLQGHTRTEAARLLGVPEGTLSARLSRALGKLRRGLGRDPLAVLAVAGSATLPAGLAAATVRAGGVCLAGGAVPPAVAAITHGVLHMSWAKTLTAVGLVLAAVAGTGAGVGLRADPPTEPAPVAKPADKPPTPREAAAAAAAVHEAEAGLRKAEADAANIRAHAEAQVQAARARLAALRARGAVLPADGLVVTDSGGGVSGSLIGRYKLVERSGGHELVFLAAAEDGLLELLVRARAARPTLPVRVEVEPHQHADTGPRLVWVCGQAGYATVHYTGPKWADSVSFILPILPERWSREFEQPKYTAEVMEMAEITRRAKAGVGGKPAPPADNPSVKMVSGPVDTTKK